MTNKTVILPFKGAGHSHSRCLDTAIAKAEKACLERGLRLTPLRRRVLELVWGSHEPVKAYDILDELKDEQKSAAPPTVYRALEFLQQQGFVHRIESLNAYVGCGEPGHASNVQFLICHRCGEVAELEDPDIIGMIKTRAGALGFVSDSQTIEVKGCCAKCHSG